MSRRICGDTKVKTSWVSLRSDPNKKVGPKALQIAGRMEAWFWALPERLMLTVDDAFSYFAVPFDDSALEDLIFFYFKRDFNVMKALNMLSRETY